MKKEFSKSWSFRKKALFNEITSRGYELYFNNRWTKINSEERYWLIIFSKSSDPDENKSWYLKFWLWDSELNKIIGENSIVELINPEKPSASIFPIFSLAEAYLNESYQKIVFRPEGGSNYLIFGFDGILLHQTGCQRNRRIDEKNTKKNGFSKLLPNNLFLVKLDEYLWLYNLNENNGFIPKEFQFGFASNISQNRKDGDDIKLFQYVDNPYIGLIGYDKSPERGHINTATVWIYKKDENQFLFISKLVLSYGILPNEINIETSDKYLLLSILYNDETLMCQIPNQLC